MLPPAAMLPCPLLRVRGGTRSDAAESLKFSKKLTCACLSGKQRIFGIEEGGGGWD